MKVIRFCRRKNSSVFRWKFRLLHMFFFFFLNRCKYGHLRVQNSTTVKFVQFDWFKLIKWFMSTTSLCVSFQNLKHKRKWLFDDTLRPQEIDMDRKSEHVYRRYYEFGVLFRKKKWVKKQHTTTSRCQRHNMGSTTETICSHDSIIAEFAIGKSMILNHSSFCLCNFEDPFA